MQGRPDQNGRYWDKDASQKIAAITSTGKYRAIPRRPPTMSRVKLDTAPGMPRVPRPQYTSISAQRRRKILLIGGGIFAIAALLACTVGYLLASGILASAGPAATVTDFLGAVSSRNYTQSYSDLGPGVTLSLSQNQFTQQALALDTCYGPVTNYKIVDDDTTNQNNIQSYTYTITRSRLSKTYQSSLTLQQDQDANNSWKIYSYGGTLGPTQPAPACSK